MSEYMHLVGAEQVQQAANDINRAADKMARAATDMHYAIDRQKESLDNFITEFRDIVESMKEVKK
jgi:hypothetical protein